MAQKEVHSCLLVPGDVTFRRSTEFAAIARLPTIYCGHGRLCGVVLHCEVRKKSPHRHQSPAGQPFLSQSNTPAGIALTLALSPLSSVALATDPSISRTPLASVSAGVGAASGSAFCTGTTAPNDAGLSTTTSAMGASSVEPSFSEGVSTTATMLAGAGLSTGSSEARSWLPVSIAPDTGSTGSASGTATVSLAIADEARTGWTASAAVAAMAAADGSSGFAESG